MGGATSWFPPLPHEVGTECFHVGRLAVHILASREEESASSSPPHSVHGFCFLFSLQCLLGVNAAQEVKWDRQEIATRWEEPYPFILICKKFTLTSNPVKIMM